MIDSKKLTDLVCDTEKKFNKSRKQIAEEIGISRDMLYKLMATDRNPSAENLQKIANYFHVSTDYLLKPDEETANEPIFNSTVVIGSNNQISDVSNNICSDQRKAASNHTENLTPDEAEFLKTYRSLTPAQRSAFLTLAKTLK